MPQESPAPARQPQLRRRIPLELTAEQLALLERQERHFGTKRATLVAGLEALARLSEVEAEFEQATRARDEAQAEATALAAEQQHAATAFAKTKAEASAAKKERASAQQQARATSEDAQDEIERLEQALADERKRRLKLERELEEVEGELLEGAFCPRCAKYVAPNTWATKEQDGYELVYHKACGFHLEDGLTKARSVFGYRSLE